MPKEGDQIKGVVCFCHGYGDTCTFLFEGEMGSWVTIWSYSVITVNPDIVMNTI